MEYDHSYKCRCPTCLEADKRIAAGKPKRQVPRFVLEAWKEKQNREANNELQFGYMEIQCPFCRHYFKVKISPSITCLRCGKVIQ